MGKIQGIMTHRIFPKAAFFPSDLEARRLTVNLRISHLPASFQGSRGPCLLAVALARLSRPPRPR